MQDVSSAERKHRTAALLERAAHSTGAARQELLDEVVVLNIPVARSLAARYRDRGQPQEDLEQVAYLALTRAVHDFHPDRGEDLLVFAVPTILGELKRYFRDTNWAVRPPRRIQELRARLTRAEDHLTQELSRSPRPSEVAEHLGCDVEDVLEAQHTGTCGAPDSIDAAPPDGTAPLGDRIPERDPGYARREAVVVLGPACRRLRRRDRTILRMRFYEQRTQQQIADAFGISQVQVSRLLQRILADLRRTITGGRDDRSPARAA